MALDDTKHLLIAVLPWILILIQVCCLSALFARWRQGDGIRVSVVFADLAPAAMLLVWFSFRRADVTTQSLIRGITMLGAYAGYRWGSLHQQIVMILRDAEEWD